MLFKIFDLLPAIILLSSVSFLVPLLAGINYYLDYLTSPNHDSSEVFDFIIVGSGSAGAVVANRLSKNNKVLLIEAGGDPVPYTSIPLLAQELMHHHSMNWNYKTVPQKYSSQAMVDKRSLWPRGKVLGGTSNLNFMYYVRGNPYDYDQFANISGDPVWRYENVLPYFKKSLDYQGSFQDNEKHYGKTPYGHLHVEKRLYDPMHEYFIDGGKELGYDKIDLNGPQQPGFGHSEVSQKHGSRSGTYAAFIKNFLYRDNLRVSRYSQAVEIKFDKNNRAEGVWFIRNGKKYLAKSSKEIIVSAGAVDSPKLLMLSGIGPRDHLKSLKIKTKVDLPVGKNLQDHLSVFLYPFFINKQLSFIPLRDLGIQSMTDYPTGRVGYFVHGHGPFTSPGLIQSYAFISSKYAPRKDWPDLQIYVGNGGIYDEFRSDISRITGIDIKYFDEFYSGIKEQDAFLLMPTLVLPKSVGEITLKDKNPLTPPLIDPRYLEDPQDVKTLIEGIKFCIKLGEETKSFKRLDAKLFNRPFPGCEHHRMRSDEYWECYIRHMALTLYHPVGTCRMGKATGDPKAVVDSKLRVINTRGLRISDTSIMPKIVNGNTNAPAIMIGEMASNFIREYWSEQYQVCDLNDYYLQYKKISEEKCFYTQLM